MAAVRSCCGDDLAVYPVGGATGLDFGLPPRKPGIGLSLSKLCRVIDYPARDMTVTVEAGITMRALADLLSTERQRFPIDVPLSDRATLGGVIATNFNGPRRYGCGTIRDHVIGIAAVDGRGVSFKGGGRVVKNVAGYDLCKLLVGSLGTLGVITQVTLKLKPCSQRLAVMVCWPPDEARAETRLAALVQSQTTPTAIELLGGPAWRDEPVLASFRPGSAVGDLHLAVALEGSDTEVRWMTERLGQEWWNLGVAEHHTLVDSDAERCMQRLAEFPASGKSPLVLRASVLPSRVASFCAAVRAIDPDGSWQAHAGNGIVVLQLSKLPQGGVVKGLIGSLQSAAGAAGGTLHVLASAVGEATHQSNWGPLSAPRSLLTAVKREFDPRNILNPDRFVF
jgi:glycolate oxidase FAD binding subunit